MDHLGFHSLTDEVVAELPVDGSVPDWLSGSLVRNGPGAFEVGPTSVDHWFDGLAMLHKFTFVDGAVRYRNRFLRSDSYEAARTGDFDGGFATGSSTLRERLWQLLTSDPYDNANIVAERIGDRYVALTESPRWVEFDPQDLHTVDHVQYDGPEPSGQLACAHLGHDPTTDAVLNVETEFGRPSQYHVHEILAPDRRRHLASVPTERPSYLHSFAVTPSYVVLAAFPFDVDPLAFLKPGEQPPFVEHFEWRPDAGTRIVAVDRTDGSVAVDTRTEAVFGFHHVNAYDADDGTVVFDLETVPDATSMDSLYLSELRAGELSALGGRLERFRLDPDDGAVDRETIHEGATALPTVPRHRWCRRHRYVYAQGTPQPVTDWPELVRKIDVETGAERTYEVADGHVSEPIFVPRSEDDRDREDDGVVLAVALDDAAERSHLLVLDGETLDELARAPLPHAVPFDFHGRYFPELTA
jgi:carotenoid cleavage dioxygenase-like enzyme